MPNSKSFPWLILSGATAVGKTDFLESLYNQFPHFELISADAYQVYRGFDLGTAKPPLSIREKIPHHGIDILEPFEAYDVAQFVNNVQTWASQIITRGKIPVISGGTAFYIKHLLFGLPAHSKVNTEIRDSLQETYKSKGIKDLFAELEAADPARASQLHINDHYRILRALEIVRSGEILPSQSPSSGSGFSLEGQGQPYFHIVLSRPRPILRQRIKKRISQMMQQGLSDEWKNLYEKGYGPECPAMKAIGYREFFLDTDLNKIEENIFFHTCQYAKRQETFYRNLPVHKYFDIEKEDSSRLLDSVLTEYLNPAILH